MTTSPATYVKSYLALLGLTALTVLAAQVDVGRLNVAVALLIACTKASVVALYFMHLKGSRPLVILAASASLYWLAILIAITMSEVAARPVLHLPGK